MYGDSGAGICHFPRCTRALAPRYSFRLGLRRLYQRGLGLNPRFPTLIKHSWQRPGHLECLDDLARHYRAFSGWHHSHDSKPFRAVAARLSHDIHARHPGATAGSHFRAQSARETWDYDQYCHR